ncbi:MAG: exodeoxyribonuclease VII small subunit [Coriobacteriia bacterium]|nr:exodeoxyribonuclease VII small subunit [Coriobacteriia bacterium]
MANNTLPEDFTQVKQRLDAIVKQVSDDALPLDDALALYEEAVQLGMRASQLIEQQTVEAMGERAENSLTEAAED